MLNITTSKGNMTFNDGTRTITVPVSSVYAVVKDDTVSFLLTTRYPNEGQCIFSALASEISLNGNIYGEDAWTSGEALGHAGGSTFRIEIVDELPSKGEDGTIYFILNDDGETYTEYVWLEKVGKWEVVGSFTGDIDLTNYYTKSVVDAMLSQKQDKLVSGTNIKTVNGESILGSGDIVIKTNTPFPTGWRTNGTIKDLIDDINADMSVVEGKTYMKTVNLTDMPSVLKAAEMKIEILKQDSRHSNIILFTITSADTKPYHWEYTSVYGKTNEWRAFLVDTMLEETLEGYASKDTVDAEIRSRLEKDTELQGQINGKADKTDVYTKEQIDNFLEGVGGNTFTYDDDEESITVE